MKRTNWQGFDSKCFPFQVFEPNENFRQRTIAEKRLAPNAGMSGFLIPFKVGGTFISLGDSDSKREDRLALEIEKQTVDRPLFFKISHHGSRFSSRADFLKRLSPDEVVISSGVGNSFGHPYPGVIQNLLDRGVPIHRTDREGSVIFKAEVYRHQ